jgi:hypothetical protein
MLPVSSERSPVIPTEAYRFALAEHLRAAKATCLLISAYLTADGLSWIADCLAPNVEVSIVTRWEAADLAFGASDTAAYWLARKRGWAFRALHELHAKCCLIDDQIFFIGSANLTNRGLCLTPGGNRELGLYAHATPEDRQTAWSLYRCGVAVTDNVVRRIEEWLKTAALPPKQYDGVKWPSEVDAFLAKNVAGLWVADLPWSTASNVVMHLQGHKLNEADLADIRHDVAIFSASTETHLRLGFRASNCLRWLLNTLSRDSEEQFAFFGRLTECLHTALLDDPRPYRKDVKVLLANLITYTTAFADDQIVCDRPNYSERLSIRP